MYSCHTAALGPARSVHGWPWVAAISYSAVTVSLPVVVQRGNAAFDHLRIF